MALLGAASTLCTLLRAVSCSFCVELVLVVAVRLAANDAVMLLVSKLLFLNRLPLAKVPWYRRPAAA